MFGVDVFTGRQLLASHDRRGAEGHGGAFQPRAIGETGAEAGGQEGEEDGRFG